MCLGLNVPPRYGAAGFRWGSGWTLLVDGEDLPQSLQYSYRKVAILETNLEEWTFIWGGFIVVLTLQGKAQERAARTSCHCETTAFCSNNMYDLRHHGLLLCQSPSNPCRPFSMAQTATRPHVKSQQEDDEESNIRAYVKFRVNTFT